MDSAFKLFFVKPTKLELDMFVVTLRNPIQDKTKFKTNHGGLDLKESLWESIRGAGDEKKET